MLSIELDVVDPEIEVTVLDPIDQSNGFGRRPRPGQCPIRLSEIGKRERDFGPVLGKGDGSAKVATVISTTLPAVGDWCRGLCSDCDAQIAVTSDLKLQAGKPRYVVGTECF